MQGQGGLEEGSGPQGGLPGHLAPRNNQRRPQESSFLGCRGLWKKHDPRLGFRMPTAADASAHQGGLEGVSPQQGGQPLHTHAFDS